MKNRLTKEQVQNAADRAQRRTITSKEKRGEPLLPEEVVFKEQERLSEVPTPTKAEKYPAFPLPMTDSDLSRMRSTFKQKINDQARQFIRSWLKDVDFTSSTLRLPFLNEGSDVYVENEGYGGVVFYLRMNREGDSNVASIYLQPAFKIGSGDRMDDYFGGSIDEKRYREDLSYKYTIDRIPRSLREQSVFVGDIEFDSNGTIVSDTTGIFDVKEESRQSGSE